MSKQVQHSITHTTPVYLPHHPLNYQPKPSAWPKIKVVLHTEAKSFTEISLQMNELLQLAQSSPKTPSNSWSTLQTWYQDTSKEEREKFLKQTFPAIKSLALQIETQFPVDSPDYPTYFVPHRPKSIKLKTQAVASIVACGFLNLLGGRIHNRLPEPNFIDLLTGVSGTKKAKLEMFLNYFHYFASPETTPKERDIVFVRKVLREKLGEESWISSAKPIQSVKLFTKEKIEDSKGSLHVDFANCYIGGGALSFGCVQEEIMFSRAPECCASMALFFAMEEQEAIYISGAKYFSDYLGYARSLAFGGDHDQNLKKHGKNEEDELLSIVAIDAIPFGAPHSSREHQPENILREINKAYTGFVICEEEKLVSESIRPIATGNWGCGAFGGRIQLKALIQLIAGSQAERPMEYYSFGETVANRFEELVHSLREKKRTVGWLSEILFLNDRQANSKMPLLADVPDLFQFVLEKNQKD